MDLVDNKLDEILDLLDKRRGRILETRALEEKDGVEYKRYSSNLRLINALKKDLTNLFDTDQKHLGL
jgi:hypothetical protein